LDQSLIQIVVLAFIAGFILFRLYTTLGKRTGAERPPEVQPAQGLLLRGGLPAQAAPVLPPGAPGGDGVMQIMRADPNFDPGKFLSGARSAYELIVGAFAKGDRDTLKPLLTPRVYEAYDAAIAKRVSEGGQGPEVVRLKSAELQDASLTGNIARVVVKFDAELAEGAHGVRDAHEKWTFERDVRASDPNWRLSRVAQA
jgi:predicted lipid-binding transport protein (Tim44 family)